MSSWIARSGPSSDTDVATLGTLNAEARAFFATKTFESEVGNGGLHQFFFNHPNPLLHEAVIEGYETLGLVHQAGQVREVILPVADAEKASRASIVHHSSFVSSYEHSQLPGLDELVGDHVSARCELVRANPSAFVLAAD